MSEYKFTVADECPTCEVLEVDILKGKLEAAEARIAELERRLDPRRWTYEEQQAWHQALPDLYAAFETLRK